MEVSCIGFEPSAAHTYSSKLPDRSEANTMRCPSGEKEGSFSSSVDAAMRTGRWSAAESDTFQRFVSVTEEDPE